MAVVYAGHALCHSQTYNLDDSVLDKRLAARRLGPAPPHPSPFFFLLLLSHYSDLPFLSNVLLGVIKDRCGTAMLSVGVDPGTGKESCAAAFLPLHGGFPSIQEPRNH